MTFLIDRLTTLGITEEQNTINVIRIEGEEHRTDTPYFSSDNDDNIRILYPKLDGGVYTYDTGSKNTPDKWFYRLRLKNPNNPSEKYTQPKSSGTRPFFPKNLIDKYQNKVQINTIVITEGEFKAFKADIEGFDCIGSPSIHGFYGENKSLHPDIVDLLAVCQVQNLIFLTDADTVSVNWEEKKDLALRPTSFYSAVKNFAEATKELGLKRTFFAHIQSKFYDTAKGLDDLLCLYPDKIQEINTELLVLKTTKKYFNFIELTNFKKVELLKYFGINRTVQEFYGIYKKYIGEQPFTFRDVEYIFDGKAVIVVEQEDAFNADVQNASIFTERMLQSVQYIAERNIKNGLPINVTYSECFTSISNVYEATVSEVKLRSIIEKIYTEKKSIFNINNKHYILKLGAIFESSYPNFRRNELSGACEMDGVVLSDADINTIMLDIEVSELLGYNRDGKPVGLSQDKFYQFINSNYTSCYHPIKQFFEKGELVKDQHLIKKLASTIYTNSGMDSGNFHPDFAEHFIRKWLVSCVASVYGTPNPLLLILSGTRQRTGKTEWFRRLVPNELLPFCSENKITDEKDQVLAMIMSEKFMILDDEMSGLTKADAKRIKYLCSVQSFTYKRPYAKGTSTVRRLANLCATTNDPNILTDPTGNRRLIPIDVQSIDHKAYNEIDKTQLWLEAYSLYKDGWDYTLSSDDVKKLNENTKDFEAIDRDMELLRLYFDNPERLENKAEIIQERDMTASEICLYIEERTRHKINPNSLGIKLKTNLGLSQIRSAKGRHYKIAIIK